MSDSDLPLTATPLVHPPTDIVFPVSARARRALTVVALVGRDPHVRARLHELAREATHCTGAENAQISVLSDRQTALVIEGDAADDTGMRNFEGTSMAFEDTICALALRTNGPVVISDARSDARVSSLPSVTSGLVGSYLGAPVRDDEEQILAVLCVFNAGIRRWLEQDLAALERLAHAIGDNLRGLLASDPAQASA